MRSTLRKGQFFIITTVLISGALLFISTAYLSTTELDYTEVLERHDAEMIENTVRQSQDLWWDANWLYRRAITVKQRDGNYLSAESVSATLPIKLQHLQPDCSDLRLVQGDQEIPWILTTACPVETYDSRSSAAARYKFDTFGGQFANDSTGNGHDGVLGGTTAAESSDPQWVSGKYDSGLYFDGNDDIVEVSSNTALAPTNDITVSAWVYSNEQLGATERQDWVGKQDSYTLRNDERNDCNLGAPGPIFEVKLRNGSWYGVGYCGSDLPAANTWHHYVGVYDSASRGLELWVDGELVAQRDITGVPINANSNPLTFGAHRNGANYFNGVIDDVRIYPGPLSPGQIRGIHQNGIGLTMGVNFTPQEQVDDLFAYYGNTFTLLPDYTAADITDDPQATPTVTAVGPEREREDIRTLLEQNVEHVNSETGSTLRYAAINETCEKVSIRSSLTALERIICTRPN